MGPQAMSYSELTPEEVEAGFVDEKAKERRGHCRDDVDQAIENVGIPRCNLVLVHQKDTVRSGVSVYEHAKTS